MPKFIQRFLRNEEGAVTTDWIVLGGIVVSLGIAVASSITVPAINFADGLADHISGASITSR